MFEFPSMSGFAIGLGEDFGGRDGRHEWGNGGRFQAGIGGWITEETFMFDGGALIALMAARYWLPNCQGAGRG